MSAHLLRPIGILAFVSALLSTGAVAATDAAFAADCLAAPGSSAPNSHWYYRTDRAQQRKCWFLRSENAAHGLVATGQPAPGSLASFKEFLRQRTGAAPSDQDAERLYAAFLEWNRRAGN